MKKIILYIVIFFIVVLYSTNAKAVPIEDNQVGTKNNPWDISESSNDDVKAWLSEDGTLTIYGTGNMKDWNAGNNSKWHNLTYISNIKKIIIEEGITKIGDWAFFYCESVTEIRIPESINSIGNRAFENCNSLTQITIPNNVTSIGNSIFNGCKSLEKIKIQKGVTGINDKTFIGCSNLTEIEVDINNENYYSENGILFNRDKSNIICYPAKKEAAQHTIPIGVTRINDYAFTNCSNLTEVEIPNGLKSIGGYAFFDVAV